MVAMTTGGDAADLGRHHSSCCGEMASCGREGGRHHRSRGNCCGESYCSSCASQSCSTCGTASYCPTCGYASSVGCPTCSNGFCPVAQANTGKATIVVSLPADAQLTIDDEATTSTSDHRVFVSPDLPAGKEFHYTLKAEVMLNGKIQVVSQIVAVRAGEETKVTLSTPTGVAER